MHYPHLRSARKGFLRSLFFNNISVHSRIIVLHVSSVLGIYPGKSFGHPWRQLPPKVSSGRLRLLGTTLNEGSESKERVLTGRGESQLEDVRCTEVATRYSKNIHHIDRRYIHTTHEFVHQSNQGNNPSPRIFHKRS